MYIAEVLSKFPVVQHFPFGSIFPWERDPNAVVQPATMHVASQPSKAEEGQTPAPSSMSAPTSSKASINAPVITAAPWAKATTSASSQSALPSTSAPWASARSDPRPVNARVPGIPIRETRTKSGNATIHDSSFVPLSTSHQNAGASPAFAPTKAPWAK